MERLQEETAQDCNDAQYDGERCHYVHGNASQEYHHGLNIQQELHNEKRTQTGQNIISNAYGRDLCYDANAFNIPGYPHDTEIQGQHSGEEAAQNGHFEIQGQHTGEEAAQNGRFEIQGQHTGGEVTQNGHFEIQGQHTGGEVTQNGRFEIQGQHSAGEVTQNGRFEIQGQHTGGEVTQNGRFEIQGQHGAGEVTQNGQFEIQGQHTGGEVTQNGQFEIHLSKRDEGQASEGNDGVLDLTDVKLNKRKSLIGTCHICNKRFANLSQHMLVHSDKRKRNYPCHVCGKGYYTKQTLSFHLESHPLPKNFHCLKCGKAFHSLICLNSHMRDLHSRMHLCSYCGKTLGSYTSLFRHLQAHGTERKHKCKICGKAFKYPNVLKDHVRIHTGERPWSCEICGLGFKQRSRKKIHIRSVHNSEKNYPCDKCGRKFTSELYLSKHTIRIHSENPPRYGPCGVCGKSFTTQYALKKHANIHVGNIKCNICEKHFVYETSLQKHIRYYRGRKPFLCGHCGKCFHTRLLAKRHILEHLAGGEEKEDKKEEKTLQKIRVEIYADIRDESDSEDEVELKMETATRDTILAEMTDRIRKEPDFTDFGNSFLDVDRDCVHENEPVVTSVLRTSPDEHFSITMDTPGGNPSMNVLRVEESEISHQDPDVSEAMDKQQQYTAQAQSESDNLSYDESSHFNECESYSIWMKTEELTGAAETVRAEKAHREYILTAIPDSQNHQTADNIVFPQTREHSQNAAQSDFGAKQGLIPKHEAAEICETCGKATTNMRAHRRTHSKAPVECEVCGRILSCKTSLYAHMKSHGEKKFQCSICSKKYTTKLVLKLHMNTHTDEPFQCQYCPKKFSWRSSLISHTRLHTKEKPYPCRICGRNFRHTNARIDHERTHTGERPHVCDICGKAFTQRSSLRSHWHIHKTEKDFQCEICHKKFSRKNGFKQHLKRHGERKKFTCEICGTEYTELYALKKHMKWHGKLSCASCRRKFTTKQGLEEHEQKFKDIQPTSCGVCGRMFHWKGSAKRHMDTHTGQREHNFKCPICFHAFRTEKDLDIHEAQYIGQKPFVCAHCGKQFHLQKVATCHIMNHLKKALRGKNERNNNKKESKTGLMQTLDVAH